MNEKADVSKVKILTIAVAFIMLFFVVLFIVQIVAIKKAENTLRKTNAKNYEITSTEGQITDEIAYRETEAYKNDLLRQEKFYGENDDIIVD